MDEGDRDLPRKLRRLILQYLEGEEVTSQEDGGMSLLLELNDTIDELKKKDDGSDKSQPKQIAPPHHPVGGNGTAPNNPDQQRESISASNVKETVTAPGQNLAFAHPLYRRDLKIVGQIGEPNQKDTLGYVSLERQIARALNKRI